MDLILGITGISLGGHNCSLAGASYPEPISIIPCLSWTTASCVWNFIKINRFFINQVLNHLFCIQVFTQGVLSGAIPWNLLCEQLKHFGEDTIEEFAKLINSPERSDIFDAGRQFAKQYPIGKNKINELVGEDNSLYLDSESYFEQLTRLNEAKLMPDFNFDSSDKLITEETTKPNEKDGLLNFINTVSFNIYDSLNKTLISPLKAEKKDDNSLKDAINFMHGILDECTHLKNFDRPIDTELCKYKHCEERTKLF